MAFPKINIFELEQLHRTGKTVSEIAKELGVTKGAVSKRLKSMNLAVVRDVATRSAPQVVAQKIDAMAQLSKANDIIKGELNYLQECIREADEKGRLILQDAQLKHVAEIRKQIGLLLQIAQTLYSAEQVAEFQKVVLEEIGNVEPEVKQRILNRLQERRAPFSVL